MFRTPLRRMVRPQQVTRRLQGTYPAAFQPRLVSRFSTETDEDDAETALLEQLLAKAKARKAQVKVSSQAEHAGPKFNIGTFNAISPVGLKKFHSRYRMMPLAEPHDDEPHAILLRSHKLKSEEVPESVRAIARCGAGTNNIPVDQMTSRGIPVFNTPGANANAVKELTICGMLLASRGVSEGINHLNNMWETDGDDIPALKKRVETDKKLFVGQELTGKTLGVIGLGHIGTQVAVAALALGMKVVGFDPAITVQSAWTLPGDKITRANDMADLLAKSDYVSLHVPYIPDVTHHLINEEMLGHMKPNAHVINLARGELVDSQAMRAKYDNGSRTGKYIADFADEYLHDHNKVILVPHLGASTEEAEENSASMAAETIMSFAQTGQIRHSVNFPPTPIDMGGLRADGARLCIVNRNVPGVLGLITSTLGDLGLNIRSTFNSSRGEIAYNVVDLSEFPEESVKVQDALLQLDGVLSTRLLEPTFEVGHFVVNEDAE
jgi:D-3-phosphoglycerate dehydrogenase